MREEAGTNASHIVDTDSRDGSDKIIAAGPSKWESAQTNLVSTSGEEGEHRINGNNSLGASSSKRSPLSA